MTTTARILQSHGLNANKASILAREIGMTDDTEQPVIGTTVGGAKYMGTEDFIQIVTAAPAAVPILRRSKVIIECNTATAGASVALDIRNGAQVAGYSVMVLSIGGPTRSVGVQYSTGVIDTLPYGSSKSYVWTGAAWSAMDTAENVVITPLSSVPAGNVTVTLPTVPKTYNCIIPKANLIASAGGPFALTLTTGVGGKETVIVPILAVGSTALVHGLEFMVYVDIDGNVYSENMGERPVAIKASLADADEVTLNDSASLFAKVRIAFSVFKSTLKTYFDNIYQPITRNVNTSGLAAYGGNESYSLLDGYSYLITGVQQTTYVMASCIAARIGNEIYITAVNNPAGYWNISVNTAATPKQIKITNETASTLLCAMKFTEIGRPV